MDAERTAGPEELARARRAQRRAVLKQAHPDLGGSTDDFLRALRTNDDGDDGDRPPHGGGARYRVETTVRGRVQRVRRRARRTSRALRNRLPRRLPGARRDTTL